jgi:hypothetical protein
MINSAQLDTIGIGLDDGGWQSLSCDVAESLLRVCSPPAADERSYSSVQILPRPSGQDLYVRTSFSG